MALHRDRFESTYRSNYAVAFSPRDEKPWKKFDPTTPGEFKIHSRTPNKSRGSHASADQREGIFPHPQLPPIFKPPELEKGAKYHLEAQRLSDKAVDIEQSILAERRHKEVRRVIRFYQHRASPNCVVVLLVARWLRLDIDFVDIDLQNPASLDFLKSVNAFGTIPVVVDDDFVIPESRAIIKYLVCKFGNKQQADALYPQDPVRRGYVDTLIDLEHSTVAPVVFDYVKIFVSDINPTEKAYHLKDLEKCIDDSLNVLTNILTVRKFFGSDSPCLADVVLARDLALLEACQFFQKHSHLQMYEWLARMKNLPNWQEAMEACNGFIYSKS